ncbi:MAG: type IV toxin-antitoxin system AbiEi family antitoxin domain-containing protein [Bdellovibrionota bacterium]
MSGEIGTKINQVLKVWPQGTVAASSWLEAQGIYHQLAQGYEHSAWIKRVGHGAYIRDGDQVDWQGALYAIQNHLKLPIHAAAKTALELHGITHFVSSGPAKAVFLLGAHRSKLPSWFKAHDWGTAIHFSATQLFSRTQELGLTQKDIGNYSIQVSSRERAVFELLHLVPQSQGYDEASLLFESLRTLRPDLVQQLLENCGSVKVKRLFLHLAEKTNQEWFSELNLLKVALGKGKRVIAEGGVFDSKYGISVPNLPKVETEEGL